MVHAEIKIPEMHVVNVDVVEQMDVHIMILIQMIVHHVI
jgi:hypothetical protein